MTTTPLPPPDTHCFDDDTQMDVWSYSAPLVEQIVKQARSDLEAENMQLKRDSKELTFLANDLMYWVDRAVGNGNANFDIEEAWGRYEDWCRARNTLEDKP